jgi:hypothetical protein
MGSQATFLDHLPKHGGSLGGAFAHTHRNLSGGLGAIGDQELEDGILQRQVLFSLFSRLFSTLGIGGIQLGNFCLSLLLHSRGDVALDNSGIQQAQSDFVGIHSNSFLCISHWR